MALVILHGNRPGTDKTACGKDSYYEVTEGLARMRMIGWAAKNGEDIRRYIRPSEDMCSDCLEHFKNGL